MTNPYEAPSAPLQDTRPAGRPVWVWIISIFYGIGTLSSAITIPLLASGAIEVPAPQREQLDLLGSALWVFAAAGTLLTGAFVVQLFRLRASAVRLCVALLIYSLANNAWQILTADPFTGAYGWIGAASSLFSFALLAAVLAYVVRLGRRGVLV